MRIKKRGQGKAGLIEAARLEFEQHGFDGTNTNIIANRAGYAPQTFYRHFADKRAVFLAVYQEWATAETRDVLDADTIEAIAAALIHHHKTHRIFRRSLRSLTVTDPEVATARANARLEQMRVLEARTGIADRAQLLTGILKIERLCDAIADNEFAACGISEKQAMVEVVDTLRTMFSGV